MARVILHLRELRNAKGLSLDTLCEMTGMSHTHLSRLERGLHETKTGTLAILCEALGCTIDELVTIEHGGGMHPRREGLPGQIRMDEL